MGNAHEPQTGLAGVVATPVTPFSADGVDEKRLHALVDFVIRHGAHAVALPMHIGESLKMRERERRACAEVAVAAAGERVPVLINTSAAGTDEVVEASLHAQGVGAEGVVVINPYHWRASADAQLEHFGRVCEAVSIDVYAYNYPERLGVALEPGTLQLLRDRHPNFKGVKDASLAMDYVSEVCRVTGDGRAAFSVFTGIEYLLPGMVLGASGCFSPLFTVAPRLVRDLHDACRAEHYDRARVLQHRVTGLLDFLMARGYPVLFKVAMQVVGRDCGSARGPSEPVDAETVRAVEHRLAGAGVLDEEPQGWE